MNTLNEYIERLKSEGLVYVPLKLRGKSEAVFDFIAMAQHTEPMWNVTEDFAEPHDQSLPDDLQICQVHSMGDRRN